MAALIRYSFVLITACLGAFAALGAEVNEIVVTGDSEYTRIIFAADAPIEAETFLLSESSGRQIDVRLSNSFVSLDANTPPPGGAIDAYEIRDGEVVFNLTTPMMVSRTLKLSPTRAGPRHRLLVDLVRVAPLDDATLRRKQEVVERTPTNGGDQIDAGRLIHPRGLFHGRHRRAPIHMGVHALPR